MLGWTYVPEDGELEGRTDRRRKGKGEGLWGWAVG
jgi:hypothetical protein